MQEENKNKKSEQALREERVLEFWRENDIFNKTLSKDSAKGEFVFYEGPPTANGKPGIHHLESRAFKDAIPRYKTMQGYHVARKAGWDTHGLPVELQVEKSLNLNSKKAIEEYGIAKFNKKCKESVSEYLDTWSKFTDRIGYWVDQKNPYFTYQNEYIESVWNIIKETDKQGLLYKDYRIVPWCSRCGTTLSSHELSQGYMDVKDLSVTAKFKIKGQENTYILAWTTTPWTLPGNVALAVGKDIDYVILNIFYEIGNTESGEIKDSILNHNYIVSKERLKIFDEKVNGKTIQYKIIKEIKGSDLVGLEYEPLYPQAAEYIKSQTTEEKFEKAYKVYDADFVTTTDGTGIVHTAVMYGADDFELGTKIGLPKVHLVDLSGRYIDGLTDFAGRFVKDEELAVDIIKDLAHRGLLFKKEKYEHSYPHCWRCKTPLIYYARDSWYIKMSSLRDKLVNENQKINWEPNYIRDGRFGEWIRDVKDWAISRERYWGTPLPIWVNESKEILSIGSLDELKRYTKKSLNTYFVMRHGQTSHNVAGHISTVVNNEDHLTDKGKSQVEKSAKELKEKNVDIIIASPFARTRETAEIVAQSIGLPARSIIYDDRLHEISVPMYEGRTWAEYHADFPKTVDNFDKAPEGNESYKDMKRRMLNFLFDIEKTYKDKKILIVTHGGPAWVMVAGAQMLSIEETLNLIKNNEGYHFLDNAEVALLPFVPFPHNEDYELDLHRPYIDEIVLEKDSEVYKRVNEVLDCWFDSGSMPFAQDHYPFENKEKIESKGGYPADYICEAIDQTRGWFYTLHAVGALMGKGLAYKNVICLGHILDASGKKMSKSQGNIVDPWVMIDKYGVDTLRLWMYSVNQPGESKNFDEKTVSELNNKVFNLLYNVRAFYELYRDKDLENKKRELVTNILDTWILARLAQLTENMTEGLDNYKLLEPVRNLREFIDDLSTWYVRRSRELLKDGNANSKQTLYYVLKTLAKLIAPFAPFASEDIWQKLKNSEDKESVHLENWPEKDDVIYENILEDMANARAVVTLGLESRQRAGIKVRQPLGLIKVKSHKFSNQYTEIIKDELNVKDIIYDNTIESEVELDTYITEDLRREGQYRELVRAIQDMRKTKGLIPSDIITLGIATSVDGQELINEFKSELMKVVGAKDIIIGENEGTEIKIEDITFTISIS